MPREPLLEVCDLGIQLLSGRELLRGVSFDIPTATIAGLSGDSGSGKTTLALALLKLLPPTRYAVSGQVRLRGRDLLALDERAMETVRGAEIAMIFQDPLLALNPVLRIRRQIAEILRVHRTEGDAGELLRAGGHRVAGAHSGGLSPRTLGRRTAARDDRAGPGLRAGADCRGRTLYFAGRTGRSGTGRLFSAGCETGWARRSW